MLLFWLKVAIAPLLIGTVSIIERRYGPKLAGLFIGLPLTSGPISLFLASEQGEQFSSHAALGTMIGIAGCGAFCVGYALACSKRASCLWSLVSAFVAFALLVSAVPPSLCALNTVLPASALTLLVSWLVVERLGKADTATLPTAQTKNKPAWDLPLRMSIATATIVILTLIADRLGAQMSGVLSSFPVLSAVLVGFSHMNAGHTAAVVMIRGLAVGCFSALAFFAAVALLLSHLPILFTYSLASAVALTLGAGIMKFTQAEKPAPAAA
ncbi:MAG TPA: hypothetical protein V6C72_06335 [Chroococcales cyanobacterium]